MGGEVTRRTRQSRTLLRAIVDRSVAARAKLPVVVRAVDSALLAEAPGAEHALDVRITSDRVIRRLNREYRGIDAATDVLSFPLQLAPANPSAPRAFVSPPGAPVELGDLVLSWDRVEAQAAEYGHAVEREAAYLTVHGVLHLLGYDHERDEDARVMREREERVLSDLELSR